MDHQGYPHSLLFAEDPDLRFSGQSVVYGFKLLNPILMDAWIWLLSQFSCTEILLFIHLESPEKSTLEGLVLAVCLKGGAVGLTLNLHMYTKYPISIC